MRKLIACLACMPLIAAAADYVEAGGTAQITGLENTYPAWSPDGSRIVFESTRDGRDGSEQTNLTRHPGADGHPRVSPDGRLVYFNSNRSSDPATFALGTMDRQHNHEIYTMSLDGGDVRRVTELPEWDTYPAVSPDGSQLLWRRIAPTGGKSESGRNSEVFWMNLATGEQRNVTSDQAYDGWPAWSPDGRRIAFASNRANAAFEAFMSPMPTAATRFG